MNYSIMKLVDKLGYRSLRWSFVNLFTLSFYKQKAPLELLFRRDGLFIILPNLKTGIPRKSPFWLPLRYSVIKKQWSLGQHHPVQV